MKRGEFIGYTLKISAGAAGGMLALPAGAALAYDKGGLSLSKGEPEVVSEPINPIITSPGERLLWETYGQYVFRVAEEEGNNWKVRADWLKEVIFHEYRDYILGNRYPEADFGPLFGPMQFTPPTFRAFYRDPDIDPNKDPFQKTKKSDVELMPIMRDPRINISTAAYLLQQLGPQSIYQQWPNTGPAAMIVLGMRKPEEILLERIYSR